MVGLGVVSGGLEGGLEAFFGWVGGFLIFAILAVASLPAGWALRWVALKTLKPNPLNTMAVGVFVGLALIPVLHPAMRQDVMWSTHGVALVLAHGLSGAFGGWVWWQIETPYRERTTA